VCVEDGASFRKPSLECRFPASRSGPPGPYDLQRVVPDDCSSGERTFFLKNREAIDTEGPRGRAMIGIISTIAELEKSLIVEKIRIGHAPGQSGGPPNRTHTAR
jgi:hypothetical protein